LHLSAAIQEIYETYNSDHEAESGLAVIKHTIGGMAGTQATERLVLEYVGIQ
jgi:hypothetical protein